MIIFTTDGAPSPDTLLISGFGGTPLSVDDGSQGSPPSSFELHQNYPNPFNPTTIIRYGLPQRVHVSLNVYNSLGQQVAVLVDGWQDSGKYETRVDGKTLASGLYFYRLIAGDFVQTRKFLLIR